MEFIPVLDTYATDLEAQLLWAELRATLSDVDGFVLYRHPTLGSVQTSANPDFVVLARGYEPLAIRIVRFPVAGIVEIDEESWTTEDGDLGSPVADLEDFTYALRHRFEKHRSLRERVSPRGVLALPHISEAEFRARFGDSLDDVDTIWKGQSAPLPLPRSAAELSDQEWRLARSVLQSATALSPRPTRIESGTSDKVGHAIRLLDQRIALLDVDQLKGALQIAPGPQRIRGLAGTGKTALLALKAATIHSHYPDKKVLFTFFTQSLYNQAKGLISRFYRVDHDADPDWSQLHIRHAWGGKYREGVYYELCERQGMSAMTLSQARGEDPVSPFRACCEEALKHPIRPTYDYVLVDEGQDLPAQFFEILFRMSRDPHAIYFAYDELQNLTNVELPKPEELFGKAQDGTPNVTLEGEYPGEMEKDIVLRRSYRCPREVLMLAHGVGLGIHGPRGPVQMLQSAASWHAVGYEIEKGSLKAGEPVVITRPDSSSPNPIHSVYNGSRALVETRVFATRPDEIDWIVNSIEELIGNEGVRPEHIIVTFFDQTRAKAVHKALQAELFSKSILSTIPGIVDDQADFAEQDKVTLTTAFRVKGNEAPVVFLFGCEKIHSFAEEIELRNKAFTCISRSKGWVRISGIGAPMTRFAAEISHILGDLPQFRFSFPDMKRIRSLDAKETTRRRQTVKRAKQSIHDLLDIDASALDDVDRKQLAELLQKLKRVASEDED